MSIEKALLAATGEKPQKSSEPRQKFLVRMMVGVQNLPEEKWEELGAVEGAQDWYNTATEADNADKPVPDFPDIEEEEAETEEAEEAESEESEAEEEKSAAPHKSKGKKGKRKMATVPKAAAKKPAKKVKTKTKAEAAPKKSAKPAAGRPPMKHVLKLMVAKKPKLSVEDLMESLEKKGYGKPSRLTVSTFRADARGMIKALNELGITKIEI